MQTPLRLARRSVLRALKFPTLMLNRTHLVFAAAIFLYACAVAQPATNVVVSGAPRVYAIRPELLESTKSRIAQNDPELLPALKKLVADADAALKAPIVAVTDKKTLLPPSGDAHDYFSLSPYWWPDPSKPNGLPYIRRDGETNPESKKDLDQPRIAAMGSAVHTLALAWYFTGNRKYATQSAKQLRAWFLDSATRMNPHLRFSQLVRGNDAERGSGIIDTRWFIEAVDAAGLLQNSSAWTSADGAALKDWFRKYLAWLRTSDNGKHEQAAKNNHGSWFAAQTAVYAMFTGDTTLAREIVESAKPRIGWQIQPDGNQPIEMERTRSMHYSAFNVEALSRVAEVGHQLGIDLWHYRAPEGGSLRAAIDHIARYISSTEKWPGTQIDPVETDLLIIHLRRGETLLGDSAAVAALRRLPAKLVVEDQSTLLYPPPVMH